MTPKPNPEFLRIEMGEGGSIDGRRFFQWSVRLLWFLEQDGPFDLTIKEFVDINENRNK